MIALLLLALVCSDASSIEEDALSLRFEALPIAMPLAGVTDMIFLPGGNEVFILEKEGRVVHAEVRAQDVAFLGAFSVATWSESDCGLISGALSPDFVNSRHLYLARCVGRSHSAIERFTFDPSHYDAIRQSSVEILRLGDRRAKESWHNVGDIGFDEEGNLWALFGDKTIPRHGSDPRTDLGAMVRIRVAQDGASFEGALGNPYADPNTGSPNVYAYGLRSPFKGVRDSAGRVWVGDVGANRAEEVNVVAEPAQNFGWPVHEGPCNTDCDGVSQPTIWWSHGPSPYVVDDPEALPVRQRVVWVGLEYRGTGGDRYRGKLTGRVLLGDLCVGFIRSVLVDARGTLIADDPVGHLAHASAWAEGADGCIYAVANGGCGAGTIADGPTVFYRALPR